MSIPDNVRVSGVRVEVAIWECTLQDGKCFLRNYLAQLESVYSKRLFEQSNTDQFIQNLIDFLLCLSLYSILDLFSFLVSYSTGG
ncbi:hypothetical protein C462_00731 [Halorubrum distributum JCM 13916]|uniref:Uncharacterized protein n=1 Tax=Halorubrum distributum JCM 13916 TaxID=1230455 RepID=M0PRK4_9EURY|nr:hypothetical protein C462_00731 [Halorubrum arcis JCM 13916]